MSSNDSILEAVLALSSPSSRKISKWIEISGANGEYEWIIPLISLPFYNFLLLRLPGLTQSEAPFWAWRRRWLRAILGWVSCGTPAAQGRTRGSSHWLMSRKRMRGPTCAKLMTDPGRGRTSLSGSSVSNKISSIFKFKMFIDKKLNEPNFQVHWR